MGVILLLAIIFAPLGIIYWLVNSAANQEDEINNLISQLQYKDRVIATLENTLKINPKKLEQENEQLKTMIRTINKTKMQYQQEIQKLRIENNELTKAVNSLDIDKTVNKLESIVKLYKGGNQ